MAVFKLLGSSILRRVMVKTPNPDSRQIYVTLPAGMRALFNQLVGRELYGNENSAVARHLITVGLEDLVKQGRLIDLPIVANTPSTDVTPDASEPR
jgi:hypothetical protein